ncbi:putative uncharacterized protein DDB_G0282133 isoform X1 [Cucurbita moschata]|uniref:Uncharacterized protein n=1 Tax=Cucurbita moschata TaxID=3662 RepID=A0A6J1ESX0_CUCMO|nr:putative uncharacterized protein DDB_G0282133 isoform X1 [Cucurbita moschata]
MGTPTNGSKTRWMMGLHLKGRKESDNEDLHLFRELHKRGKERTACFLLPVHDLEHSNGGNSQFYRIQPIRKESEFELLSEGNKNDYDWLKTPPATPLFPSLEMEAIAPHMKAQKETRFLQLLSQPQSQASNNSESTKRSNGIEKSPTTNPRIPSRSITPSYKPRINSSTEPKNTQRITNPNQRISQASSTDPTIKRNNNKTKSTNLKESYTDYLTSNLSKPKAKSNPNPNPRSRTTSPIVRSTIASQIPDFSNETPPNLRTDRSSSVTRGRQVGTEQKPETININSRRQSCSPSVTRGRKVEVKQEINRGGNLSNDQRRTESTNIIGSRMVERVMNARKGNKNASKLCV